LCLADDDHDLLCQLAHVLAAGASAVWPATALAREVFARLPAVVQARVALVEGTPEEASRTAHCDAVLLHGDPEAARRCSRALAQRPGAIVGMQVAPPGRCDAGVFALERLTVERSVSVNTAAAGGNASLMTLD
jgi:RHH-type proline utilization regulon transcriptional repressor/proline dehydrogenase/delta 1-pyrroline-5-carboxylate dehydrogenase